MYVYILVTTTTYYYTLLLQRTFRAVKGRGFFFFRAVKGLGFFCFVFLSVIGQYLFLGSREGMYVHICLYTVCDKITRWRERMYDVNQKDLFTYSDSGKYIQYT